jgi:uncharacterized protein (DUF58 family)
MTDFESPLVRSNSFAIAARKHEIVAILASDPLEWKLPAVGRIRIMDPESGDFAVINTNSERLRSEFSRSALEKRNQLIGALSGCGVDWAEFSTGDDFEAPLRHFFESRISRRGYRRP